MLEHEHEWLGLGLGLGVGLGLGLGLGLGVGVGLGLGFTPCRSPPSDEGCCRVDVAMSTRAYEERPPRKPHDSPRGQGVRVLGFRV